MDGTQYLFEIALALDGLVTLCVSVQYFLARRLYNCYVTALDRGINSVNSSQIELSKPACGVVRGQVKALAPLIKSLSRPSENGVLQNVTIKEHAVLRLNGRWETQRNLLDSKFNAVPFEIGDANFHITVKSPLEANYLHLPVIETYFEPSSSSIIGLLFGIHQKGFQFTEYMLKENDLLTAFGEIIVGANKKLELVPPSHGIKYILTTEDPETLALRLRTDKEFYGFGASLFGLIGIALISVLLYKWWRRKQEQIRKKKLLEMAARARLERQRNQPRDQPSDESFTCIICLHHPREVILLPCGHISMCYDCAYLCADRPCPVCRERISSIHSVYLS